MANIIQTFPAGAGSGHTILDSDGTAVAQEKNLKITGLSVTDNPTDESTDLAPAGLNQDSIDDISGVSLPGTTLVSSGLNFSETEQIVGRWIDGRPIYQKSWYKTTSSSFDITIDTNYNRSNIIPLDMIGNVRIDNGNYIEAGYAAGVNFIVQEDGYHVNSSGKYNMVAVYTTLRFLKVTS